MHTYLRRTYIITRSRQYTRLLVIRSKRERFGVSIVRYLAHWTRG